MTDTNGHPENHELGTAPTPQEIERAMLLALKASTDEAQALQMLKNYVEHAQDAVRADAMAGFPSLAAVPEERQSYAFAATAARWLRCARKMAFEEGVAFVAVELQRNTAALSLGIAGSIAKGFQDTFKPEPEQIDEALTELARGLTLALPTLPPDEHQVAIAKVLRAARNVEARPKDHFGNYL